mgnify:CR=1 FL=1
MSVKIVYIRPDIRFHLPSEYVQFNHACPGCDSEGFISCGNAVLLREEDRAIFPITRKSPMLPQTLPKGKYLDDYWIVDTLEHVNKDAYDNKYFLNRL